MTSIQRGDVLVLKGVCGRKGLYEAVVLSHRGFNLVLSRLVQEGRSLDFKPARGGFRLNGSLTYEGDKVAVIGIRRAAGQAEVERYEKWRDGGGESASEGFAVNGLFFFGQQ